MIIYIYMFRSTTFFYVRYTEILLKFNNRFVRVPPRRVRWVRSHGNIVKKPRDIFSDIYVAVSVAVYHNSRGYAGCHELVYFEGAQERGAETNSTLDATSVDFRWKYTKNESHISFYCVRIHDLSFSADGCAFVSCDREVFQFDKSVHGS